MRCRDDLYGPQRPKPNRELPRREQNIKGAVERLKLPPIETRGGYMPQATASAPTTPPPKPTDAARSAIPPAARNAQSFRS